MDGFRFDLMGILDVTTMQKVRTALNAIDPSIIVLGEGWNMGGLPESDRAAQINIDRLSGIAAFNDQIRDGIKGSVFSAGETGWATGNYGRANDVASGITGNVAYSVLVSPNWTTNEPGQSVNYVEAHDNLTLFDKLNASTFGSRANKSALQRFTGSIVYLSQGMPFQQAGQEWERTKNGDENSYSSGDDVNMLKYKQRVTYATTYNYYKGLIALRKAHPAFRMQTTNQIKSNLSFISRSGSMIAYRLNGTSVGDSWKTIVVAHNAGKSAKSVTLPAKTTWYVVVKDDKAGTATLQTLKNVSSVSVAAQSTLVVYTK
jgi:pullulanase